LFGTGNKFDKSNCHSINGEPVSYAKTIFNKLSFVSEIHNPHKFVKNDYTCDRIVPDGTNIVVVGFNQNLDLFRDVMYSIPKYFNLEDTVIKSYIFNKYGDISNATILGVRIGKDFSHMKKIQPTSYVNAIKYLSNNTKIGKIYVISDIPTDAYFNNDDYTQIIESDIVQLYFGILSKNYILSESTFHLWMAYLGTDFGKNPDKLVVCFNNTDITNRKLHLESFICLDY